MIRVVHPGSRILMLTYFHPGSRIQGSKRYPIPDPGSGSAKLLFFLIHNGSEGTLLFVLGPQIQECYLLFRIHITRTVTFLPDPLRNSKCSRIHTSRMLPFVPDLRSHGLMDVTFCFLAFCLSLSSALFSTTASTLAGCYLLSLI